MASGPLGDTRWQDNTVSGGMKSKAIPRHIDPEAEGWYEMPRNEGYLVEGRPQWRKGRSRAGRVRL